MREPYWPIPERRSSWTMDSRVATTPGAPRPDFRTWVSAPDAAGGSWTSVERKNVGFVPGHDFAGCRKILALYQGTTFSRAVNVEDSTGFSR